MMTRRSFIGAALAVASQAPASGSPAPYGATPSARQLRWHEMETYAFLHFTVNTFTDKEWGYGDEDPSVFNPTAFDPDQIVEALKAGGMKGAILTCKHHDGFCLWPTETTDHCIRSSRWRDGKGDVVRDISRACHRHGLRFGVYLSPWDRNNPHYGTPEYIAIYRRQLRELLTRYGPIFEVWHDGANGGNGYYGGAHETRSIDRRTYYDWPTTWEMVRKLQPDAVIFSDVGPDIRWVGNESGYAAETCWATFRPVGEDGGPAAPGYVRTDDSGTGTRGADRWLPAECDVSIRPGWFWHESENARVKTPADLMDLYFKSVGRGASFLLNVPPDRQGQLYESDVRSLRAYGDNLRGTFGRNVAAGAAVQSSNVRGSSAAFAGERMLDGDRSTYWATDDGVTTPSADVDLGAAVSFDVVSLREEIRLGQRIESAAVDAWADGDWREVASVTSIGAHRLVRLAAPVTTTRVRLRVTRSPACTAISELGLYRLQV